MRKVRFFKINNIQSGRLEIYEFYEVVVIYWKKWKKVRKIGMNLVKFIKL